MTRHSKNSTAGAFFTAAERDRLAYGTRTQRLGRDSLRQPDRCHVCLQPARGPVVCESGHLFCRECILQAILSQHQQRALEQSAFTQQASRQAEEERRRAAETQRKRIADFERLSTAVQSDAGGKKSKTSGGDLNAFWIPSRAPEAIATIAPPKKETICPAGDHTICVKKLIPVVWHTNAENDCICRLCDKKIATVTRTILYRKCGHVFCLKCHEQVVAKQAGKDGDDDKKMGDKMIDEGEPATGHKNMADYKTTTDHKITADNKITIHHEKPLPQCPDCGKACMAPADLIPLAFDGTGFSNSGGNVQVKKYNPAFI